LQNGFAFFLSKFESKYSKLYRSIQKSCLLWAEFFLQIYRISSHHHYLLISTFYLKF
jgi:hypothetical protein